MKTLKKLATLILILTFLAQLCAYQQVFAYVDDSPQETPQQLDIDKTQDPSIGYNQFDDNFFNLTWKDVKFPADAANGYLNFYLQELTKPYRPVKPTILKERDVAGTAETQKIKGLLSGTIYYAYMTAYHTHAVNDSVYQSAESVPSNKVKVLTDIKIDAYPAGTNQIKIEWDDVWDSARRIDYKLYVSENSSFTNTQPIYIGQNQIGSDKPVKVNESSGKLEYVHSVRDAGRVYYVKIAPDISDVNLKRNPESEVVTVSSFILARTTRISSGDSGTIWRMEWSPVITGLSDSDIKVTYKIYRGVTGSNDLPQYMASVDDITFYITVPLGEDSSYYLIRAFVTRGDEDVYPNVKIQSDIIIVKEQEVATTPSAPEFVDIFSNVISYKDELKPNKATLLWRVPKKANGETETGIKYDVWLVSNPNQIDNPPTSTKLDTNLQIPVGNYVMDGTMHVGYKYPLANLTANSTYYFKIVAKKTYLDYVNGVLGEVTLVSQPAIKVVITPTEGNIDQPIVPARPPFKVRKTSTGKDDVTDTTATVTLKDRWYEGYVNGLWQYIDVENSDDATKLLLHQLEDGTLNDPEYRIVQYDTDVTLDIGCIKFLEGMSYSDLTTIPANKLINVASLPNDPEEDKAQNIDNKKHNINIVVPALDSNTTYIIWVRAARRSADLVSGPSDPVIITTNPKVVVPIEKPIVPTISYSLASDTYVDLGWEFKAKYGYYLKYNTEENINTAKKSITITPQELLHASYYRVKDLQPDTIYYFWIQAEASNDAGEKSKSEWSDSYLVKTLAALPPETPDGFGVKDAVGTVTKNSITFEWLKVDGLEYILEVADNTDYKNLTEYKAKTDSEYKVDGLKSNHRYYARLYAYDPIKKLKSIPTTSITVRTERSDEEYDSDQDIEDVLTGDYVVKDDEVKDKTWNINVIDANADRFIERAQKDNVLDYKIDVSTPPAKVDKIVVLASNKIFKGLSILKENLIISTANMQFVIRPEMLNTDIDYNLSRKRGVFNYQFVITLPRTKSGSQDEALTFKTGVAGIKISGQDGNDLVPVDNLRKPLKVAFMYTDSEWYKEGVTSAYTYHSEKNLWQKVDSVSSFDTDNNKGYLSFEMLRPCEMAVAEPSGKTESSYGDLELQPEWVKEAVEKVTSVHKLKSIDGSDFEHTKIVSMGEAVKLMLDVLDYNYNDDYMMVAAKSGLIEYKDVNSSDNDCSREKAIVMIARLYEMKTGEAAVPTNNVQSTFTDLDTVAQNARKKVEFAIENGMVIGKHIDLLAPKDSITRAEVIVLLEKLMAVVGEIE